MRLVPWLLLSAFAVSPVIAQQGEDVRALRGKLAAGDLPSAESILEVHRAEKGEDPEYLLGLAWLARGAALTGDWTAASRYAGLAAGLAQPKLRNAADYEANHEAAYALGAAFEVQAQVLQSAGKKADALRYLEEQVKTHGDAPYNFRARMWKRWNLIGLGATHAPEFDWGPPAAKPVVLFFWAEWCGDCKSQAPVFRRMVEKYAPKGVVFIAPTRLYSDDHAAEKERLQKVWQENYAGSQPVNVPISDEAMVRYGVSSTPTFAFVDRKGIVRLYSPTRLTEARLSAAIDDLLAH
jgi:thiol-disulfide isomerase/thioredoxin